MTGTILNTATVLAGTGAGLLLRSRIPKDFGGELVRVMGLFTLVIGLKNAWSSPDLLVTLVCVVLGTAVGMVVKLDDRLNGLGDKLKSRLGRVGEGKFTEGLMAASLLFCIGPMTVMGSISDGLTGDYSVLAMKAVMDGITSMAMASTLGIGVGFSALVVFVVQGTLTLGAGLLQGIMTDAMLAHM
ncbi:MAG TPA: DUF554 domain-containing protein, partial [Bacillota bacterium]|nr:DUF554 domain-containing protein [Bacillota bacterium]